MRKPRALRPGDRVAVVSPASPFKREEFEAGLVELRTLGFEPVFEESVFARRSASPAPPTSGPQRSREPGPTRKSRLSLR